MKLTPRILGDIKLVRLDRQEAYSEVPSAVMGCFRAEIGWKMFMLG